MLVADMLGQGPRLLDETRHDELTAHPPAEKYPRTDGVYQEWITVCKGGAPAGSNFVDHAGPLTEMVLLGNLALRMGRTLELDSATGRVTNVQVPEHLMRPNTRNGWTL